MTYKFRIFFFQESKKSRIYIRDLKIINATMRLENGPSWSKHILNYIKPCKELFKGIGSGRKELLIQLILCFSNSIRNATS